MKPWDIKFDSEFVCVAGKLCGRHITDTNRSRSIIITPFDGEYGRAGYVVAIEGSPNWGLLIVEGLDERWQQKQWSLTIIGLRSVKRVYSDDSRRSIDVKFIMDYLTGHLVRQALLLKKEKV